MIREDEIERFVSWDSFFGGKQRHTRYKYENSKGHTENPKQLSYPLQLHCNNSILEEIIGKEKHQDQKRENWMALTN